MKTNLLVFFFISLVISSSTSLRAQKDSLTKPEYYKVSKVRIFINDQSDVFELRKQGLGFGFGSMGGFYTFNEVVAQLDTMRLLYPNLITVKDSIGSSIEGRTIWAVKISDNPDVTENEPQVFYNA